ncbi:MAG: protein kinase [Deltaproteobacteria bacterium]|nr:protein kinase [Deltaproteobacteria bacterium]MBW2686291.1 protein kinase [Deltaproteobacteria bacterium]
MKVGSETSFGDLVGEDFGPYKVVRRLGVGGMAETFEAIRHGRSGFAQRVCLKLVRPAFRDDVDSIQLFEREARLAAKLHHSNIVGVIDFGDIDGTLYMALELVEGVDLQRLLGSRNRLSPEQVALLGHDLAAALEHAHNPAAEKGIEGLGAGGILHRDISPSNVLISQYGEIKLTDFGLANVAAEGSRQSAVKGKFPYMAPERLRDESLDGRSDLFSLGVVLFEALAGRRPYEGGHDPATIMLIIEGEHSSLCDLAPGTPQGLCEVVESLIEPDRERRPRSAAALVERLDEFVPPPAVRRKLGRMVTATRGPSSAPVAGEPLAGSETPRTSDVPPPPVGGTTEPGGRTGRNLGKIAALAALLLGGAGLAVGLWPSTDTPHETEQRRVEGAVIAPDAENPAEAIATTHDAGVEDLNDVAVPPTIAPPSPARITVLISPWGNIWINGKPRGAAPLKNASLKPGRYKVSAGQGSPSETRTVRMRAGQRKTIRFDLTH